MEDYTVGTSYLGTLDYGARHYDPRIARWTVPDPMAEKYYGVSAYNYCAGNPVMFVDPDGRSTYVKDEGNGRYRVIGGDLGDDDRNIYIYYQDERGQYTIRGESIGLSATMTSFYSSDFNHGKGSWMDTIIDISDESGVAFINSLINQDGSPSLSLISYMDNARNNEPFDFKTWKDDYYRGMPVWKEGDKQVFSSARDIGNYVAGYYAAANGFSWSISRLAFDSYQGGKEGISTVNAQLLGWSRGSELSSYNKASVFLNSSQSISEDLKFFLVKELVRKFQK